MPIAKTVIALATGCLAASVGARADELPMPRVDYVATYRMGQRDKTGIERHHDGKLRVDVTVKGTQSSLILDIRSRKGKVLMTMAEQKLEMDLESDKFDRFLPKGPIQGHKVGRDHLLGEVCDVWDVSNPATEDNAQTCITADGVPLKMVVDGRTMLEALSIERTHQDPSLFVVPPGYAHISMPAAGAMMMLPGFGGNMK